MQGGLKTLQKTEAGKGVTNFIKGSSKGPGIFGKIKNFGVKKFNAISSWADNLAKNAMKNVNNIVKGGLEQASKWRKQLGSIAELVKNPMKLLEKAKGILRGKMDKMVQNNNLIKQIKEVAKDPKKIKSFITKLGKNKDVVKTVKTLKKGAKTIKGLDAVLAALMGVIDYTFLGESPINAALRAAGALVGYSAGFAVGAPFGGVPGFFTGIAGSFLGEKVADVIAAGLVHVPTPLGPAGEIVDPIMGAGPKGDGRMIVRNPFGGQGEGERMDNIQEKQAELGDNKKKDVSQDISSSASYEDDGTEELILIDGGGQQSSSIASLGGKPGLIPIGIGKDVNSEYEMISNAALYKV